jgi:phage terminase large subunit
MEATLDLNKFVPRPYQIPIFQAIENKGFKRVIAILPRRAGKDLCAFNLLIRAAIRKPGVYWMCYPTYQMGRKILFDSLTSDGIRFLDYIPKELIESINSTEMKIRMINQSLIQVVGSDNYNSLVGTNALGIIFSEWSLQDERVYQYLRPVLTHNDGFALFITTPRGKNHAHNLWQIAIHNPEDWFAYKLTVEQTKHIPLEAIEKELLSGEMSEDLIQQEYYCSFDLGIEGAYYTKYIDRMRLNKQIGIVPWENGFKVNTAWDLGVRDSTVIIFFQTVNNQIRIIDCYEKNKQGLEHYVNILNSKPYVYGKHFAPADIIVKELGTGLTRLEKSRQLGLKFETRTENNELKSAVPNLSIEDGIEAVRSSLGKIWIDELNCKPLIKAIENYRQEYDAKRKVYKPHPLHDNNSHFADALRYLCVSLPKTRDGLTPEELDRQYREAVYGGQSSVPNFFRDINPY